MQTERVAIYLDAAYLFKASHSVGIRRISFRALQNLLAGDRTLVASHYYDAPSPPMNDPQAKERFVSSIRNEGWRVFMGRLNQLQKHGHTVYQQKMVDTKLVTDLVLEAAQGKIDTAILIASDADFVPAVLAVKQLGVRVELYHLGGEVSFELKRVASQEFYFERELRQQCARQTFIVPGHTPEPLRPSPNTVAENFPVTADGYIEVLDGRTYRANSGDRVKVRTGGIAYVVSDATVWALNGSTVYAQTGAKVRASKQAFVHDWAGPVAPGFPVAHQRHANPQVTSAPADHASNCAAGQPAGVAETAN